MGGDKSALSIQLGVTTYASFMLDRLFEHAKSALNNWLRPKAVNQILNEQMLDVPDLHDSPFRANGVIEAQYLGIKTTTAPKGGCTV
jgi:hypothetical protein